MDSPRLYSFKENRNGRTVGIIMKRQKHYETAQSIETEIDKLNESKRNNLVEVVAYDKKIEALLHKMLSEQSSQKREQMKYQLEFIRTARDAVDARRPLIESKLNRLKKTHAAFHTVDMFGVQQVVLQK